MSSIEIFGTQVPDKAIIGLLGEGAGIRLALANLEGAASISAYELDRLDPVARALKVQGLLALRREGHSVVVASWNEELLVRLSDEIWWIENSRIRRQGDPGEVIQYWREYVAERLRAAAGSGPAIVNRESLRGDGRASVIAIDLLDASGASALLWNSGDVMIIRPRIEFHAEVEDPVVGMLIRSQMGLNVYGTNTELERLKLGPRRPGDRIAITFEFACNLCPGEYTVTVASHDPDGTAYEWLDEAVSFTVVDSRYTAGVANLKAKAAWELY